MPTRRESKAAMLPSAGDPFLRNPHRFSTAFRAAEGAQAHRAGSWRKISEDVMRLPRRRFLQLAGGAAALPTLPRIARAQAYPTRPVHFIVSFAAGGPNDTTARLIAQYLGDELGQQVVVENRTGAGGNVGMEAALKSLPDGYTIAFVGPNNAISATLYEKLPFD